MLRLIVVLVVIVVVTPLVRLVGAAVLLPLIPLLPLIAIGIARYGQLRSQQRQLRCPKCELRLAYRRLGPSHGMLECPALCGHRRFVGSSGATG